MSDTSVFPESRLSEPAQIPLPVIALTAAGFLPFAFLALGSMFLPPDGHLLALQAQHIYGAVILSFLGGIYWGWEFADHAANARPVSAMRLIIGVVPSILGWALVLLPGVAAGIGLAICFLGVLSYDIWRTRNRQAPAWYPQLRIPVSIAVALSLLLPVIAR